jgi:hypothetical protein
VPYESVDRLQNVLAKKIFNYTQDKKKAAGRALGTLVEIVTFYLLKSWGFEDSVGIETALAEYGRPDITHNVEYSLHPILREHRCSLPKKLPITTMRIFAGVDENSFSLAGFEKSNATLLTSTGILRNSCVLSSCEKSRVVATLAGMSGDVFQITLLEQSSKPYAIFECKRVGVEEGMRKGPQTIEKAKQGAYVAKSVSSLQKIRTASGELRGLIYKSGKEPYIKPYTELLGEVIASDDAELLRDFILTVGVVSNHGNWFTSDDHNKELKVLAQSYDWLLFLTDEGLAEFITELLLDPTPLLKPARTAFLASYSAEKEKNRFTKVQMDYKADQVLQAYFRDRERRIEGWFNVIAPTGRTIRKLQSELSQLRDKDWRVIHDL